MPFTHHPPKTITKILLHFHCSVAKLCPTLQLHRLHFHIPSFNDTAKTCHFIPTHLKTLFPTEPQCFITATKRNNDSSSTCPNFPNFLHVFLQSVCLIHQPSHLSQSSSVTSSFSPQLLQFQKKMTRWLGSLVFCTSLRNVQWSLSRWNTQEVWKLERSRPRE